VAKSTRRLRRRFAPVGSGTSVCLRYRMPREAARLPDAPALSRAAKQRLKILEYARTHTVSATCRHFGIARSTYYRWAKRYDPKQVSFLENRSSRPKRRRRPTWTAAQAEAVRQAREQHPRWGKDKLAVVLKRGGHQLSVSMIGRILTDLHRRGVLKEPNPTRLRPHSRHTRPYATRKPKEHPVERPGDLVQVDTMHLTPLPGVERRQFTAVDVVSRYGVLGVRARATAGTARDFLGELEARMPFPVRAIQVDGGSEFMAEFETACQERHVTLFVLPPRSPKLNGHVERANGTSRREFWELYDGDLELPPLQAALRTWEHEYNHVRPHQALGYHTPAEHLAALGTPPVADVPNEDTSLTSSGCAPYGSSHTDSASYREPPRAWPWKRVCERNRISCSARNAG
jgi:putative transposase